VGSQEQGELTGGERAREEVSLDLMAPEVAEHAELLGRFHPLSRDSHAQSKSELHD
jgi:hypothetical protein